ncbi:hypothetical protein P691DRAFT_806242, partial [Macrolepiota fuliginosa MF-IS2]
MSVMPTFGLVVVLLIRWCAMNWLLLTVAAFVHGRDGYPELSSQLLYRCQEEVLREVFYCIIFWERRQFSDCWRSGGCHLMCKI